MPATLPAIFLSYASQDAEAAKRICEALRAAGVEVWFDQSELRGGDAWDAKIRKQIRECALFVPVISANTQARHEGYFRLEWHLAEQRSHLIARGRPFIVPISVDETRDNNALVPDTFLAVQWTRLPGGETPAAFCERVKVLLGGENAMETGRPRSAKLNGGTALPIKPRAPRWVRPVFASLVIVAAVLAVTLMKTKFSDTGHAVSDAPAPSLSNEPSEARQLAEKARGLFDALDSTRDDFKLAEELIAQAKAKNSTDAEVCAAEAQLHERFIQRGWDTSDARRESARAAVQRATRLDLKSFEVRLAQAGLLGDTGREGEDKERQLRELRRERPADQRVLRQLGSVLDRLGRQDEAVMVDDESAALPGGDPLALYNKSQGYWFAGRTTEAEAAIQASIAQKPFTGALLMSGWYKTVLHGDLNGARTVLNQIDPAQMLEDRAAYFAFYVEYLARRPDDALARLHAVPRDWMNDFWFRGPKGRLIGDAMSLAGRPEAAAVERRAALKLVEDRLVASPNNAVLLYNRVLLLAQLMDREKATREFDVLNQMQGVNLAGEQPVPFWATRICVMLGLHSEAIRQIRIGLKQPRHAVDYTAATLRLDPTLDPLRDEPEFQKLVAEADKIEQSARLGNR